MSASAGSLADVEAWAQHEFPTHLAEVIRIVEDPLTEGPLHMNHFDGEYVDGKILLQPILLYTLAVGTTAAGEEVYARLLGNNDVGLFKGVVIASPTNSKKTFRIIKPVVGLADTKLHVPFRYPVETGHPAGLDRLETLIRYCYLCLGEETAVQPKLGFFKAHFRAACRDVFRGSTGATDGDEMDDNDTIPDDSPPDLIADTDITGLRDNAAATSIFNEHVHAMDESYHDFKERMLTQLGAMQMVDRNEMAHLQAQVQHLTHKLAVSEQGMVKMEQERDAEKAKAQTAVCESANSKAQYEGLRQILQGALGQQM